MLSKVYFNMEQVLSDSSKRQQYDTFGAAGSQTSPGFGGASGFGGARGE